MKLKSVFVVIIISFVLSLPETASANLLYNGDFEISGEQGYTTGWTNEWNNNIFGATDNPQHGTHHARNYYDGGMYQDVLVTPGAEYTFRGYLYAPSGGDSSGWGSYLGFYWMDAQDNLVGSLGVLWGLNIATSPRSVYLVGDSRNLSDPAQYMTAPQDAVKAQVRFGTWQTSATPANPTDFDNFDFSPIPEPTSLLLLGTGLVGLLGLRKRSIK